MHFTDIFIKRPVLAIVVSLLILLAGFQSMSHLSVRQYPRSDTAIIKITTVYYGANAELIRGFITTPIERAVASAGGIDYVDSQSTMGMSTVNVHLQLNYDPLKAMSEITAKVNQVRGELPQGAEIPALAIEPADNQFAAAYLSFNSKILEQNQITDFLNRLVQPRLLAIAGVQKADILGGRTFAMRVWLKPEKMVALGITPIEVRNALETNNVQAAIGQTRGQYTQINLRADTDLKSVEEFRRLIVRQTTQGVVRLEDIADVVLGADDYTVDVNYSGDTAVFMGVYVAPNANSLEVIGNVTKEMEKIKKELPGGLDGVVAYDSTKYIRAAIDDVLKTLTETLFIIVLVIFLFLGFSRSVLIPVLAIPLSLVGAVAMMQWFGFSLNLLTLLSIVLSVGLVVDDAIIMVENIERHIENGEPPMRAALVAARELAGPIIAMTVTLISVYVPIGFQGGLTGTLFREFAITLAGAVTISAIVAIILSPMLGSRLLKPHGHTASAPLATLFDRFQIFYERKLDSALKNRSGLYVLWIGISLLIIPLYMMSSKELAPTEDQGVIFGIVESPANATVDHVSLYGKEINKIFTAVPETDFTFQINFPSGGFSGMVTKPWAERERTVFEMQPEIQKQLGLVTGVNIFPVTPPALPGGGQFPVEFVISSTAEPKEIYEYAQTLQQTLTKSGVFNFLMVDMKIDQPDFELVVDKEKVADLGLNLQTVTYDLATLLGGGYVNRFSMAGQSYKVIPQVKRSARLTPDDLTSLYITGPDKHLIRVDQIAHLRHNTAPRSINRMQQLNAVKISGQTNKPLDEALTYMETEARKILPKNYLIDYTGESRQLRREGNKFIPAFTLALTMIFLVLAAQYNSFRDPIVILAGSVPLAIFGALIFTFLKMPVPMIPFFTDGFTSTMNIYSQVGLVTLVGLIARNGILVVEFANRLQRDGVAKIDAIKQASVLRLRPVLMTSIATIAGHTPLIFATGAGAHARNSIGLILVLGMTIGTILTLFVLPAVYMLLAKDHQHEASIDVESLTATMTEKVAE